MKMNKKHLPKNVVSPMDKLKDLREKWYTKIGSMKDTKKFDESIDQDVAEHKEENKRSIGEFIQKGKDLLASAINAVKSGVCRLKEKAVLLVRRLLHKESDLVLEKRATLGKHLQRIGVALSSTVSPFMNNVGSRRNTFKDHSSKFVYKSKGHINNLKGKLSGQVDDIKNHGKTPVL